MLRLQLSSVGLYMIRHSIIFKDKNEFVVNKYLLIYHHYKFDKIHLVEFEEQLKKFVLILMKSLDILSIDILLPILYKIS